jgi:membrane-anchored mycosin MYCP
VRTPLSVLLTVTMVSACGLVGITATPAVAACSRPPQIGTPISDTPWPQRVWDYDRIAAYSTGANVKIAVLDSGVDVGHIQLQNTIANHRDFLRSVNNLPEDCFGHGTAVAGLMVATPLPGTPYRGLAPGAKILTARVSEKVPGNDQGVSISHEEMAQAVNWAVSNGAKVINLSLAYAGSDAALGALRQAIENAIRNNVVVVAAAGNNFKEGNPVPFPAAWPGVVGVAAVNQEGFRLEDSGVGSYVDIAAPGVEVIVPRPGEGYSADSGTSFAAPLVAATAALIFARYPDITADQVVKRMIATADPSAGGRTSDGYGLGVVNPLRAITEPVDDLAPVAAKPLAAPVNDPQAELAAKQAEEIEQDSWWVAGVGTLAAIIAVALMVALPAGLRRRWKPAGR